MTQRIADDLGNLDVNRAFAALTPTDRYTVLSELGFVMARAEVLDQPICANYK